MTVLVVESQMGALFGFLLPKQYDRFVVLSRGKNDKYVARSRSPTSAASNSMQKSDFWPLAEFVGRLGPIPAFPAFAGMTRE